jgi:hypothetical protein
MSSEVAMVKSSQELEPFEENKFLRILNRVGAFLVRDKILHVAVLLILAMMVYARTLGSYFIADDFPEIAYVSNLIHGHPELLISNFTGNYMQVPGMKVYRPGMLLTILLDFVLYGSKAWGYFLSNLSYFCADVVTLYFLCRALTRSWFRNNSVLFAFSSAALFAVSPLHCETISWMSGRGDPDSAVFYLLSLLSFVGYVNNKSGVGNSSVENTSIEKTSVENSSINKPNSKMLVLSVISYAVALSIKEMPVGLPAVVSVLAFFWNDAPSFKSRLLNALRLSVPFWATVAIYFLIRYFCLGTLGGGYVGGVGAQNVSALLKHWLDRDTIERLFLPVTSQVARESVFSTPILRTLYTLVGSLAVVRLLSGCCSWRFTFFISALLLTTAVPIFQLWGLGPNLEGGRFYFYLSMPLSMLIPLLLFHPAAQSTVERSEFYDPKTVGQALRKPVNPGKFGFAITAVTIATQVLLILMFVRVASKTNLLWVHAGKEDLHLSQECQKLAGQIDKQKQIVLLGVPDDYHGAHLILNRTMFDLMLRQPFVPQELASRFLTTIPLVYGPEEYTNACRLKELLNRPDVVGPYVWLRNKHTFELVHLTDSHGQDASVFSSLNDRLGSISSEYRNSDHHGNGGYSVFLDGLDLSPLDADCIEFELLGSDLDSDQVEVYWNGANRSTSSDAELSEQTAKIKIPRTNGSQKIRIRLGHYWRWYSGGRIKSLEIFPPRGKSVRIQKIKILPYGSIAPTLTVQSDSPDHYFSVTDDKPVNLMTNRKALPLVASMQLEIGKNSYFFDNFERQTDIDPAAFKVPLSADAKTFVLDTKQYLPIGGFYQLRLRCLDSQGRPIGEFSDPVTLVRY